MAEAEGPVPVPVPVLVIEFDDAVRGTLRDVLGIVGDRYAVTEVETEAEALAYLASPPAAEGMVVVCSNKFADHRLSVAFFSAVIADRHLARRHQYIMLSSSPGHMPGVLRAFLGQLHAPVLPKPFDMDDLLAAVSAAAERLALARSPVWRRWKLWQGRARQQM
jgi:CheY-like chemotaxis protein